MTFAVAPGHWVRNTVSTGGYPALAARFYVGQGEMTFILAVLARLDDARLGGLELRADRRGVISRAAPTASGR